MPPPPPPRKVPPTKPSTGAHSPSPAPSATNQGDIYGAPPQQQQQSYPPQQQQQPNSQAPQGGNNAPPTQQQSNSNFASQPSSGNFASQPSSGNFGAQASSSGYTPPPPQREPSRSSLKPPSTPSHRANTPTENTTPAGTNSTPPARPPQQQTPAPNASQPATPHSTQQARPTPASPPASPRKAPVEAPAKPVTTGPRFVEQDDGSLKRNHKVGVPSVADALEAAGYVVDEQRQKAVAQDTVVLSPTRHSFPVIKYDRAHLYEPLECTRLFPYEAPPVNKPSSTRRRTEDFLQQRKQVAPAPMFDPTVEEGSSRVRPESFMVRDEGARDVKGKEPYNGYNELVREVNEFDLRHSLADDPGFNLSNATNNESYSGWGAERSGSRRPNQSAQQSSYQQQPRTTMPADSFSLYSRPNDGSPGNVPTIQHYRTKWETSPTSARRGGSQAERYGRHYNEASSRGGSQSTY